MPRPRFSALATLSSPLSSLGSSVSRRWRGAGLVGIGFDFRHQWRSKFIEPLGNFGRRDCEIKSVEALGRDTLATAGAGHVLMAGNAAHQMRVSR